MVLLMSAAAWAEVFLPLALRQALLLLQVLLEREVRIVMVYMAPRMQRFGSGNATHNESMPPPVSAPGHI